MSKRVFFAVLCVLASLQAQAWGQYQNFAPPGASYPPGPYAQGMPGSYSPAPAQMVAEQGGEPCPGGCGSSCQWEGFADFLYLRPRDASVAYGVVFNGPPDTRPTAATPVQVSPVASVSFNYEPAWRTGISRNLDECSSVQITYTHFQVGDNDSLSTNQYQIRSMVSQPSTWISNSLSDFLNAQATYHILFDVGDVDYRWTFASGQQYSLTLLGGGRYCSLNEDFLGQFNTATAEAVQTHIGFEGGGLRFGLEGERHGSSGYFVYGRATASFIAGQAHSTYVQTDSYSDTDTVNTAYHSDRIVSIVDVEAGVGWMGPGERFRIMAGYMISSWFNMLNTNEYINAVQTNNFSGNMGSTLTFDGFFGRAELRF